MEKVASGLNLLSGQSADSIANLVENQAAIAGDTAGLTAEVERLGKAFDDIPMFKPGLKLPIKERLEEIAKGAAAGVTSAEELETQLRKVFGDESLSTFQTSDGDLSFMANVNGETIALGRATDILADSQARLNKEMGTYADAYGDMDYELQAIQANATGAADGLEEMANELQMFTNEQGEWNLSTLNVLDNIDAERLAFEGAKIAADQHAEAMHNNAMATEAAAEAAQAAYDNYVGYFQDSEGLFSELYSAEEALTEAVTYYGTMSDEAAAAAEAVAVAEQAIRDEYAKTAFERTLQNASPEQLGEALQVGVDLGLITEAEREQREAFANTMTAIEQKAETLANGASINEDYTETMNLLTTSLFDNLAQAESLAGFMSGDQVSAFMEAAEAGGGVLDILEQMGISIAELPSEARVNFISDTSQWLPPDITGGGNRNVSGPRASGGAVGAGSTYLVGEQGPELFIPQNSGMIMSAGDTRQAQGGGATTISLVQNFYGSGDAGASVEAGRQARMGATEVLGRMGARMK